ncbi:MAG: response regulator [Deltaproteobacteria bacterium]|nr:response regulator [Nannocystaceae bacterium]
MSDGIHTYAVRFESRDDFLVEYTDRLRHGALVLPVSDRFPSGTVVRLRVHLPDEGVLYLTGVAVAAPRGLAAEQGQWVKLNPLQPADEARLERCVDGLLGGADDAATAESHPAEPDADGETPLAVLLVDDSVSQRLELGEALRNRDVRVRVAENGLLALSHALKRMPDAILTDVEMPQMDGWGLLRAIRSRPAFVHVPVVFLTRLSDEATRLRGYRLGVDDYLPKSMPSEEILARLRGAIARRRLLPTTNVSQGLRGELEHVRLGSVLAFLESERRSGWLHVRRSGEVSTLHVCQGALAGVENLGRQAHPHDRVFELLAWSHGEFEFSAQDVEAGEATPLSYLLLEHARRSDESANMPEHARHEREAKAAR